MARKDHKPDGRRFNGGKRQGAGRPPGPAGGPKWRTLRNLAATYTEEAIEALRSMMHNSKDDWLRLACANALLDRGHGKPREAAIFEQQEALGRTLSVHRRTQSRAEAPWFTHRPSRRPDGARAIADELGLELRKTFYLLERGYLPATKCGATWTSTRSRLRRFFDGGES